MKSYEKNFPLFNTKIKGLKRKFNLSDPKEREAYFKLKAGPEIKKIRKYLEKNTFIAYLLGKKNSGKGTYAKMFGEVVGQDKIDHFSIGDMVRVVDEELKDEKISPFYLFNACFAIWVFAVVLAKPFATGELFILS